MSEHWQSDQGWGGGGDGGGGWSYAAPGWTYMAPAPAPPGAVPLVEAFGKGYHKGWNEGHSAGFGNGYQAAARLYGDAMWGGKGPSGKREPEDEAAESAGGKRKKKKGAAWKEWSEKYTAIEPDKRTTSPLFWTRLGGQQVEFYPIEIQERLVKAKVAVDADGESKDIEYDMTGGWMYKLRIFGVSEKDKWEDKMSEVKAGDGQPDGQLVGAQWDMNKATAEPPEEFEKGVKYRPIFLSE